MEFKLEKTFLFGKRKGFKQMNKPIGAEIAERIHYILIFPAISAPVTFCQ